MNPEKRFTLRTLLRPRSFGGCLLRGLASLLLLLILTELATRIVFFRSDRSREASQAVFLAEDFTNSQGLRDYEYSYTKPPDVYRILVLGDSFMVGFELELDETLQQQLEEKLNTDPRTAGSGYRFEVINGAEAGSNLLSIYLFLTNEGYKYQPDLILYAFANHHEQFIIDPGDPRYETIIYMDSDSSGNIILDDAGQPVLIKIPYDPDYPTPTTAAQELHNWLLSHSKAYDIADAYFLQRLKPLGRYILNLVREPDIPVFQDGAYSTNPYPPEQLRQWTAFEQTIQLMKENSAEHNACFSSYVIPGREYIYPDENAEWTIGFDRLSAYWQGDKMDQWTSEVFQKHGIPYLLLSKAMKLAAQDSEDLYFHFHMTAEGHRVGSEAVYEWLVEEQLVPTTEQPEVTTCS